MYRTAATIKQTNAMYMATVRYVTVFHWTAKRAIFLRDSATCLWFDMENAEFQPIFQSSTRTQTPQATATTAVSRRAIRQPGGAPEGLREGCGREFPRQPCPDVYTMVC